MISIEAHSKMQHKNSFIPAFNVNVHRPLAWGGFQYTHVAIAMYEENCYD